MLSKIENNASTCNKGHSGLNFIAVIFAIMVLCMGFLDLTNLVRLRSVAIRQVSEISQAIIEQGGIQKNVPDDWKHFFGNNCTNYMTTKQVKDRTDKILRTTNAQAVKLMFKTDGSTDEKNIANGSACKLAWNQTGTLTIKIDYYLDYLKSCKLVKTKFTSTESEDVTGYWIDKTHKV